MGEPWLRAPGPPVTRSGVRFFEHTSGLMTDPSPGRPRTLGDVRLSSAVGVLGFVAAAVGSVGPWITTVLGSVAGTHGDGKITLAAAVVGVVALGVIRGAARTRIASSAALVVMAVAAYDIVHIEREVAKVTLSGIRSRTPAGASTWRLPGD